MKDKHQIIFSTMNVSVDKEFYDTEYPDMPEYERMQDTIDNWYNDEKLNLSIPISNNILVIADLGLWDGHKQGYKIIKAIKVADFMCMTDDAVEYYYDGKDIRGIGHHHDGTNTYLFRGVKRANIDTLLNDIYNGQEISRQRLNYYTRSLAPYVRSVYGWK